MTKASVLTPMPPAWVESWKSFEVSKVRSEETLRVYRTSLADFGRFILAEKITVPELSAIRRDDVRGYLVDLAKAGKKPATRHMRFRSLRTFFTWMADELGLQDNPLDKVEAPKLKKPGTVGAPPTSMVSDADVVKLLKACEGKSFSQRRDTALLRVLLEGPRRGEVVSMLRDPKYLNLKRQEGWAVVVGKGGQRMVNLGDKTVYALRLYIELRDRHPHATSPKLWIGKFGPLKPDGVFAIVQRLAKEAGLSGARIHPHAFRHAFAHAWLSEPGANEGDLMKLAGWSSRAMLDRYAADLAVERARAAHHRHALSDRFP
ncbi:MAG: tyrosine-type recombinase/integrase [Candidatus Dormibacteraeota bacterium]|nr:tyrosine-type recombinase/integrase [Candidatus Dormibacteraeota bacterium]